MDIEQIVKNDLTRYEIRDEVTVLNKLGLYRAVPDEELHIRFKEFDENFAEEPGSIIRWYEAKREDKDYDKTELDNIFLQFSKVEERNGVVIDCSMFPDLVRIIYMIGSEESKVSMANVLLGAYNTELVAVSELEFTMLVGGKLDYIPIILFNRIVSECINRGGSDVHFLTIHNEKKDAEFPVKFRIGNDLVLYDDFVLQQGLQKEVVSEAVAKKSNANVRDIDTPYGVQTSINDVFGDGTVEVRLCCNKVQDGLHCVCRIQTKKTVSLKINELGFTPDDEAVLRRVSSKRSGLTLITGAIRTGKNTTAYAIGNEIVHLPVKIVEYSSPIEVYMPFPQVDYNGDVGVLDNCIRSAKKQDVNVAFINEIPNKNIAFAVKDLVNSGIHTITTTHVDRLWHVFYKVKELFGEDYRDIVSQINMVASQKMYKRVCKHCRVRYDSMHGIDASLKEYREFAETHGITEFYRSTGCIYCGEVDTLPIMEVLYFSDDIKTALLACDTVRDMEMYIRGVMSDRKVSLEYKLADLIRSGELTISDLGSII